MSSIITINESVSQAYSIFEDWVNTSNTYVGLGKVTPWSNGIISTANNSTDSTFSVFDNLFALVKITGADLQLVIPRVDWASNTVYYAYDNSIDMFKTEVDIQKSGSITATSGSNVLTGSGTHFTMDFVVGSFVEFVDSENNVYLKEVISITDNLTLTVNSVFTSTVTTNTYYNYTNTYPYYGRPFYIRNSYDQVYKCLYNNNGAVSTVMPQISLAGDLPTDPYIQTSDGYKWKYMYTIPSGYKQKFFTNKWMPVVTDLTVESSSVPGRIDIIQVLNTGNGYNENVSTSNANIITIVGDGVGANVVAVVTSSNGINGLITDTQIIDGGRGYTYANVVIDSGSTGNGNASLRAVISPEGGHGSNCALELGASNMMLCVEVDGNMGGLIPVGSSLTSTPLEYYQISIIKNPVLAANGDFASAPIYATTTQCLLGPVPPAYYFQIGDTAYQGSSLDTATFSGTVISWDEKDSVVSLNNLRGTFTPYSNFTSSSLGINITAFNLVPPAIKPYTGELLYVQNRTAVSRNEFQVEQIKIILEL